MILVLGGGGFVGSAVVDSLLTAGFTVRVFEHPAVKPYRIFASDEKIEWFKGDFCRSLDIDVALEGVEVVIHLISTTLPKTSEENPFFDVQTNLLGSIGLIKAIEQKDSVKKIIFASSGGTVYGPVVNQPIKESYETNPVVTYGITKLSIEKFLLSAQVKSPCLKTVILRIANPYGEGQNLNKAQGAVGLFAKSILQKQAITIWGDGLVIRDYIYINDIATAFLRAVEYEGPCSVFNVGLGLGKSLIDVIAEIEQATGFPAKVNFVEKRGFDVPVNILDCSLAKKELGWFAETSFSDGVKKTVGWIKSALLE